MPNILKIPVDTLNAAYKIRVVLDEVEYSLAIYFNERMNRWLFSIYDANEDPIILGIALNINESLIGRYSDPRLPKGELVLYDSSNKFLECERNSLGDRCVLLYEESE